MSATFNPGLAGDEAYLNRPLRRDIREILLETLPEFRDQY